MQVAARRVYSRKCNWVFINSFYNSVFIPLHFTFSRTLGLFISQPGDLGAPTRWFACFVCDSFIPMRSLSLPPCSGFFFLPSRAFSHSDLPLSEKFKYLRSSVHQGQMWLDVKKKESREKEKKCGICFCTPFFFSFFGRRSNCQKGLMAR